jgi:hypothetical protein
MKVEKAKNPALSFPSSGDDHSILSKKKKKKKKKK